MFAAARKCFTDIHRSGPNSWRTPKIFRIPSTAQLRPSCPFLGLKQDDDQVLGERILVLSLHAVTLQSRQWHGVFFMLFVCSQVGKLLRFSYWYSRQPRYVCVCVRRIYSSAYSCTARSHSSDQWQFFALHTQPGALRRFQGHVSHLQNK